VLDLGAGEGSLARRLVDRVTGVDAVERSMAMITVGRSLPGGEAVTWYRDTAESFTAAGPFDLAVAGEAAHWFDLPVVVGRLWEVLRPSAPFVLVDRSSHHTRTPEVVEVIRKFSRAQDYDPAYDVAEELTARRLWRRLGSFTPPECTFRQSPRDYLASLRSTSSLARALMTDADNDAFDAAVLDTVRPITGRDGLLALEMTARLVWGAITR